MDSARTNNMDTIISSPVRDFYTGKSVFITGATGFMGKVLVEKLLRSCPGIEAIYILIRAKKESDAKNRMEDLVSSTLFDRIRSECPHSLKKLIPIEGDVSLPNLGISDENEKILIDHVSVVIHSAACVHFYGRLKKIINTNTVGTLRMMELSEKMRNLESFVYVSSLAVLFGYNHNEEKVLPIHVDPWNVMKCIEWMDDDMLDALSQQLVSNFRFPYVFSKALAENLVLAKSGKFPIAIYRPTLVLPTFAEPYPGWSDSGNGFGDLFHAMQKGLLHSIYVPSETWMPLIPCDKSINALICIAWNTAVERSNTLKVYNCTSLTERHVSAREFVQLTRSEMHNYPIPNMVWYPFVLIPNNEFENDILNFFFIYAPAQMVDIFRVLSGKKRKFVDIYNKTMKVLRVLFLALQIDFSTFELSNTVDFKNKLTAGDKQFFNCDIFVGDERDYTKSCLFGIRKYYLKQDPNTIPTAKKYLKMFYYGHIIFKYFFLFLFGLVLFKIVFSVL